MIVLLLLFRDVEVFGVFGSGVLLLLEFIDEFCLFLLFRVMIE